MKTWIFFSSLVTISALVVMVWELMSSSPSGTVIIVLAVFLSISTFPFPQPRRQEDQVIESIKADYVVGKYDVDELEQRLENQIWKLG